MDAAQSDRIRRLAASLLAEPWLDPKPAPTLNLALFRAADKARRKHLARLAARKAVGR